MPFPFALTTTSHLSFQSHLTSSTHPSLPSSASTSRSNVRTGLKSYKRQNTSDQSNNLATLLTSLSEYLKFLTTLDMALIGRPISREDVDIALVKEIEVEWRPTLANSSTVPGRENERVKGQGLDYEIYFIHHTIGLVHNLLARQALLALYTATNSTAEERVTSIQSATRSLKSANSIHTYLVQRFSSSPDGPPSFPTSAADISSSVQVALQHLSRAEINLLCVLKDDPYPAVLIQSRNKDDREWMIKAPTIPKVRCQVLTRLCIGAHEQASSAVSALRSESSKRLSKDLLEYCEDIRRTSRAKACRFQALDEDSIGKTGQAIAWLRAGQDELNTFSLSSSILPSSTPSKPKDSSSSTSKLSKLKSSWSERREDKRIARGAADWGSDGGRHEELRIQEYLEKKLTRENNAVDVQVVPEHKPLLAKLPSGMNMPIDEKERWRPPVLDEDEIASLRGPPEDIDDIRDQGESSGDEEMGNNDRIGTITASSTSTSTSAGAGVASGNSRPVVGGFPGSEYDNNDHRASKSGTSYY